MCSLSLSEAYQKLLSLLTQNNGSKHKLSRHETVRLCAVGLISKSGNPRTFKLTMRSERHRKGRQYPIFGAGHARSASSRPPPPPRGTEPIRTATGILDRRSTPCGASNAFVVDSSLCEG